MKIGTKHSEETKKKISAANKGNKWNHTEETKLKLSIAHTGKKLSEEHRKKISDSMYGKTGINSRNYGNKHTSEAKKKMSDKLKGMTAWNKGVPMSEETKKKLGKAKSGMKFSKEHRLKLSLARKGVKNPQWQGGKSFEPYGLKFNEKLKELIRERDDYRCRLCSKKENGKKHSVHHIDYNKQNNDPVNLITLCQPCHQKTNFNREKWKDLFIKMRNSGFKIISNSNIGGTSGEHNNSIS